MVNERVVKTLDESNEPLPDTTGQGGKVLARTDANDGWEFIDGVTAPTDPGDDGRVAIATSGDLTYLQGSSDGDVLTWNNSTQEWQSQAPSGGGGFASEQYNFSSQTSDARPGSGQFRLNNATPASVTEIYVDDFAQAGADVSFIWSNMSAGDTFYMQQQNDGSNSYIYEVTGEAITASNYTKIPVTIREENGTVPNSLCIIGALFSSSGGASDPTYTPVNFTPTGADIDGYLEGIDDAFGTASGGIGPNTLTITSTTQSTQATGFTVLSAFEFDPTEYDGYTAIEFRALIETTNAADAAEIRLFNLDTASVVTGTVLSTTSTSTTLVSVDITDEIDTSSSIYEVQLRLQTTGSPNTALCKRAEIRVT